MRTVTAWPVTAMPEPMTSERGSRRCAIEHMSADVARARFVNAVPEIVSAPGPASPLDNRYGFEPAANTAT